MDARIPKDINKYKDKYIAGLTLRQIISLGVTLFIILPLWFYLRSLKINDEIIGWIIVFISIPCFSIGWLELHGMPIDKYISKVFLYEYIFPTKRKYKVKLEMEGFISDLKKEREKELKLSKRRK